MGREITFNTIDEYIAQFPPDIRQRLQTLREKISWAMPTFYQNGNLVHFAAFKRHVGFYPGADGIEFFRHSLQEGGFSFSKGAVQFPMDRPLPLELVTEIVRFRVSQNTALPKK
jgi:uncharacterized protein YdhG (YjbR/CyaY superfamily)